VSVPAPTMAKFGLAHQPLDARMRLNRGKRLLGWPQRAALGGPTHPGPSRAWHCYAPSTTASWPSQAPRDPVQRLSALRPCRRRVPGRTHYVLGRHRPVEAAASAIAVALLGGCRANVASCGMATHRRDGFREFVTAVSRGRQAAAAAAWRQSLRMLWVAARSRHSALAAERPRRWKRSAPRLCLIWPNTGSMTAWRRA
jgi:hypothetical protein